MRRVNVTGANVSLQDYCSAGPQYASGGFIADSTMGFVINGSQQQFYVRNTSLGGWSNGVWNQVFSGDLGAPAQSYPNQTYTTLTSTPISREKPFPLSGREGQLWCLCAGGAAELDGNVVVVRNDCWSGAAD